MICLLCRVLLSSVEVFYNFPNVSVLVGLRSDGDKEDSKKDVNNETLVDLQHFLPLALQWQRDWLRPSVLAVVSPFSCDPF